MKNGSQLQDTQYMLYTKILNADSKSSAEFNKTVYEIGESIGLAKHQVNPNNHFTAMLVIDDIEDFNSKIDDMNKGFYVLKGEITQTEKEIYSLDKKGLWKEYQKLKLILEKYNALSDSKKKVANDKHFEKIDQAIELQKIWKNYRERGNAITPKVWKKECAELKNNIKLYKWKMNQFRDELGRLEFILKEIYQMRIEQIHKKGKERG